MSARPDAVTFVHLPLSGPAGTPRTGLSVGAEGVASALDLLAGDWPSTLDTVDEVSLLVERVGLLADGSVRIIASGAGDTGTTTWCPAGDPAADAGTLLTVVRAAIAGEKDSARLLDQVVDLVASALAQIAGWDESYRRELFDRLTVDPSGWAVPWDRLRAPASTLSVLYNFQPFADTGSSVASKRLRVFGHTSDVIACSFLHHKKVDPTIGMISRPYLARRRYLEMRPSWASWHAFGDFAAQARDQADAWIAAGARYERLYTRANWAPSHYAGALIHEAHPELIWTAEFSDPLSLDVQGKRRGDLLDRSDPMLARLTAPVEADFGRIPDEHFSIFGLAEILPYALADSILFTNEHQMAEMLDHIYSPALRERVQGRAVVSHHPTLPPVYYDARPVTYEVDPTMVNVAYFGEFYVTRGITDITLAMAMLPEHIRDRIRLHVFTNFVPEGGLATRPPGFSKAQFDALVRRAQDGVGAHGMEHLVRFNASLPYLDFLAVTRQFDYLVVNDAQSGSRHTRNPFLPSKWSDYRGSQAEVWALVEDGSMLSTMPTALQTPLGDPAAARDVLWERVEAKQEDRR